jgi:hypothetical protein
MGGTTGKNEDLSQFAHVRFQLPEASLNRLIKHVRKKDRLLACSALISE